MINRLHRLALIFIGLISIVNGSDGSNYITNPASNTGINPVWTLGEQQVISWRTELEVFNVTFWQQSLVEQSASSKGNIFAKIHESDKITNFTWTVQLYGFDLDYSNVFFIWINPDGPGGFVSSYFNITEPTKTTSSTASISSATATTASNFTADPVTSDSPSTKTASPPSTTADSDTTNEASALTMTSKIALGVGVGVGASIIGALGVLIWLRARQTRASEKAAAAAAAGTVVTYGDGTQQRRPQSSMKELIGTNPTEFIPELQHSGNPKHFYPELPAQQF
ncbi:hypothetical protein N7541_005097 [Penicillium brevicompactum]|uniref:Mid2 domain-containing protein n=1 Tax=Penicillium brevicompactum TaxID=5074 RepID=A0A9W9UVC2_PENBR|nr:hypothetical protein N7541_005097 [Penicillium brevicompactum]